VFVAAMIAGGLVHKLAFGRSDAAGLEALGEPVKPWTESVAARTRRNGRTA
jgi:hypothetical protein